jgi:site-specific DNA recombinase
MTTAGAAAIYVRISHDPQGERIGVERQLADCQALVGNDAQVYEDNDTSAYQARRRPAYRRLLQDVRDRRVSSVVAYNLDRLVRHPVDLEDLLEAADSAGLRQVRTAQGDLDLSTHDGQLQARILAAVAKKASDDTARRVKRAGEQRAADGRWHGGHIPYGLRHVDTGSGRQLAPDPERARALVDAAVDLLAGVPVSALARRLGLTRTGLRSALLAPSAAGLTSAGVTASWPAILTPELQADVRAHLATRRTLGRVNAKHWLSGLLWCARCDRGMQMGTGGTDGRVRYRCPSCHQSVLKALAEDYVGGAVCSVARVRQPITPQLVGEDPGPLQERRTELAKLYAAGELGREEWVAAREAINDRLARLGQDLARRNRNPLPEDLPELWPNLEPNGRRLFARSVLHRVMLHPSPPGVARGRWDPTRFVFVWADEPRAQ